MKFPLDTLARWLHAVALSLWLGGLIAIGALVAPTAFAALRGSSILTLAQANSLAGLIVGGSLFFFNLICYVCGGLFLLSNVLLLRHASRRWVFGCLIVSGLLLASALFLGVWLTPAMNMARGQMQPLNAADGAGLNNLEFLRLHHLYEQISTLVQFPLLLLLAWLGALRDGRQEIRTHPPR